MGEAYVAQADDVSSLTWNPAGLALMQSARLLSCMTRCTRYEVQTAKSVFPLEKVGEILDAFAYLRDRWFPKARMC